jgi:hypothetical protein
MAGLETVCTWGLQPWWDRAAQVEEKAGVGGNGAGRHAVSDSLSSGTVKMAAGEGREAASKEDYCRLGKRSISNSTPRRPDARGAEVILPHPAP